MFDLRPLYCSSLTTAVGGTKDTNFVDSQSPYRGTNQWDWVKTSRNWEAMTWENFQELLRSKFFPTSARYAKAREFLELRQGSMNVLEYMAKLTKLARFGDDYVASYMAKVEKFEDGLKLSIRGKIAGLLLKDIDFMVSTTMAIEREIDDAQSIRHAGASEKMKEDQPA